MLDQPLVIGVQCVQHIHQIVTLLVGGGVVQAEQGLKFPQALLRGRAAHFLGLVQNHDGPGGLEHVNGPPGAEVVHLRADAPGVPAPGVESLGVDNHDMDFRALAEMVNLRQIFGVVDKEAGLFAVVLHKVLLHGVEALADALTDGNAGHHHDELAPAVAFVQLKHGFDVNVGFACPGFHLNVQGTGSQAVLQRFRQLDVVPGLGLTDILQKPAGGQLHPGIGEAQVLLLLRLQPAFGGAPGRGVPAAGEVIVEGLARENAGHTVHCLGLVGLDGKFEFHGLSTSHAGKPLVPDAPEDGMERLAFDNLRRGLPLKRHFNSL